MATAISPSLTVVGALRDSVIPSLQMHQEGIAAG
jgi:hypothetical protein